MGFWSRIFGGRGGGPGSGAGKPEEHAVLLKFPTAGTWPTDDEMQRSHALQEELEAAVSAAGAGELDGDEWGEGACTVYLYGPDADRLWDALGPVLAKHPFPWGSTAVKRYGGPGCGRSETINLHWDG